MQKTILRFCLVATLFFAGTTLQAQETPVEKTAAAEVPTGIFGYLSYDEVLQAMPAMSVVKAKTQALREQYEKELQRAEDEFNKKYEDFLEGQRQFAPSIYKKRQAELTDLMQRNIAFKAEVQQQLKQSEEETMAPLRQRLAAAIAQVAKNLSLAFVLNTDGNALPYVDPAMGTDITKAVLEALK